MHIHGFTGIIVFVLAISNFSDDPLSWLASFPFIFFTLELLPELGDIDFGLSSVKGTTIVSPLGCNKAAWQGSTSSQ